MMALILSTTSPNSAYFDDGPSSQFIGLRRLNSVFRIQNRFEIETTYNNIGFIM